MQRYLKDREGDGGDFGDRRLLGSPWRLNMSWSLTMVIQDCRPGVFLNQPTCPQRVETGEPWDVGTPYFEGA